MEQGPEEAYLVRENFGERSLVGYRCERGARHQSRQESRDVWMRKHDRPRIPEDPRAAGSDDDGLRGPGREHSKLARNGDDAMNAPKKKRKARPGRRGNCRSCGKEFIACRVTRVFCSVYCKVHGSEFKKERAKADSLSRYRRVYAWLSEYKMSRGCVDCGYAKHPAALQLDHEGPKSRSIADSRSSIGGLEREIKNGKCVVRCANCHSIKTLERKLAMKARTL